MMQCDWAKPLALRGLARLVGGHIGNLADWSAELVDHVNGMGEVIGTTYRYLDLEWTELWTEADL